MITYPRTRLEPTHVVESRRVYSSNIRSEWRRLMVMLPLFSLRHPLDFFKSTTSRGETMYRERNFGECLDDSG